MPEHTDPYPTLPVDSDEVAPTPGPLHRRPAALAAVAAGGVLGTSARYGAALSFSTPPGQWPVTTFAVNVVGALLLGILLEGLTRLGPDSGWRQRVRLGVGTGLLGSFTTYSTLAVETDLLLRGGHVAAAVTYAAASVLTGLVATWLGIAAGARIGGARRAETGR